MCTAASCNASGRDMDCSRPGQARVKPCKERDRLENSSPKTETCGVGGRGEGGHSCLSVQLTLSV